jgi:ornithine decarboxylase
MRHGIRFWLMRYLPSELAGTALSLLTAWIAYRLSGSLVVAALAGTVGENVGFYGVAVGRSIRDQWRFERALGATRPRASVRTALWLSLLEFGPAEIVDTFCVRPLLLWAGPVLLGNPLLGWLVGKLSADVVFYAVAAMGYLASRRFLGRRRRSGTTASAAVAELGPAVRAARIETVRDSLRGVDVDALVSRHGTPLMLLDPESIAGQYRRATRALPAVGLHYAVKALSHPVVIDTLAALGAHFDIASDGEADLVLSRGVPACRIIDTQPVKTPVEITRAYVRGIRTFVVDSAGELLKFSSVPPDARILIRLAYRNPEAASDLSSKFGATAAEADSLVDQAMLQGTRVAGFSFHVGSQLDSVGAFRRAVETTLALMDRIERRTGLRFEVLDIGGGFPVSYRQDVATLEAISAAIAPLLESRSGRLRVIAEPGRVLVADAVTVVSRVVGTSERDGAHWCFIDDGVYGSYSNVLAEGARPVILARSELDGAAARLVSTTIGGPTCDSVDVVARDYPLPLAPEGELLFSPAMGAYTAVTATGFNGRRPATIVVVDRSAVPAAPAFALSERRRSMSVASVDS